METKKKILIHFGKPGLIIDSSPFVKDRGLYRNMANAIEGALRSVFGVDSDHTEGKSIWIVPKAKPSEGERLRDNIELMAGEFLEVRYVEPETTGTDDQKKVELARKIRAAKKQCNLIRSKYLTPRRARIRAWKDELAKLSLE